jgi:hypothetical protein
VHQLVDLLDRNAEVYGSHISVGRMLGQASKISESSFFGKIKELVACLVIGRDLETRFL